jgi:hypothetical protein
MGSLRRKGNSMKELTWVNLEAEVRALAKANPKHIDVGYAGSGKSHCTYITDETHTACIVGQALTNLGVDNETLEKIEDTTPRQKMFSEPLGLPEAIGGADRMASVILDRVQGAQDRGLPWGECVEVYAVKS